VDVGAETVAARALHGAAAAVTVARPGLYSVSESGPGLRRTATVAVSIAPPSSSASSQAEVDLAAPALRTGSGHGGTDAITWLLGAALLVLVGEWSYWRWRAPRLESA
jgi:hypothetical protein